MNRSCTLGAGLLALVQTVGAAVADSYVCVADISAGIRFDKQSRQWEGTKFTANEKLVVSRATGEFAKKYKWMVKTVGRTWPSYLCEEDFNDAGYLSCVGFGDFRFNHRNGRYMSTYMVGYVSDGLGKDSVSSEEGADTPSLTAGKCSPL